MGRVDRARDTKLGGAWRSKSSPIRCRPPITCPASSGRPDLAALNHRTSPRLTEWRTLTATWLWAMELVEGPTLADRLIEGRLAVAEVLPIARQIVEALEAVTNRASSTATEPANVKGTSRRHREGARLRAGQGARASGSVNRFFFVHVADVGQSRCDAGRSDSGNSRVHESGAGQGQGSGQAQRRVGVRLRALGEGPFRPETSIMCAFP